MAKKDVISALLGEHMVITQSSDAARELYDKSRFGKRTNFIKNRFQKSLLFRDIAHAHFLACNGFSKASVILSGSVLEELLRLYLKHNSIKPNTNRFEDYVKGCKDNGLFTKSINELSDAVRNFRNIAHLEREKSQKDTISKSTAKITFGLIFTITEHF